MVSLLYPDTAPTPKRVVAFLSRGGWAGGMAAKGKPVDYKIGFQVARGTWLSTLVTVMIRGSPRIKIS